MSSSRVARVVPTHTTASPIRSRSVAPIGVDLPRARKRRASPTPHLSADQYSCILTVIEDAGGVATLDAISRAMPRIAQPISAVFDLCDAGILNVDWESALDADMAVWRVDR